MAIRYFKTDNRKLTFRECWNLGPGLGKFVLLGAKLLGIELKLSRGAPMTERAQDGQISFEELAPEARQPIAAAVARMEALGFHSPQFTTAKHSLRQGVYVASALMLHRSGEMLGEIAYSLVRLAHPPQEKLIFGIETWLTDGRNLTTSTGGPTFNPIAGSEILHLPGRAFEDAFQRHRQRLSVPSVQAALRRIADVRAMREQMEETHRRLIQERIARGVWIVMTPEEVAEVRAAHPAPPPLPDAPPPPPGQPPPLPPDTDQPVLDELEKLQQPKQRWGLALLIFGVSLVLFIGAGWLRWNWSFALLLVPVLFLHELGHYIAMRCFRYQNLRMFFIPLFGAAVTGLRLQVPGWKKGIVALAGPVPGILMGAALAFAAWRTDEYWVRRLSQLFLVVNAFNLLPLMPLDGGRVFDALFYVRSRTAETVALVLAGMGMLALSILLSTKILMFVAIAMFVGMPHLLRMARITEELRLQGFAPDPEDSPAISTTAAKTILSGLRASLPAATPHTPKMLAQFVMSIYERLHTTPPGWAASAGLLIVHGGSAVLALLALGFEPALDRWQRKRDKIEQENPVETKLFYNCETAPVLAGNEALLLSNRTTIIASSPDPKELRAAFDHFNDGNTNFVALTLCGQTLFITATNAPHRWETSTLKTVAGPKTSTLLERQGARWRSVTTHVRAVAPDEASARRLTVDVEDYFEDGASQRQGREITLRDLNFTRLDRGLPALLRFLCDRGCDSIRYDFEPGATGSGAFEDRSQ